MVDFQLQRRTSAGRQAGFTLLELLAVVVIIALLTVLVLGTAGLIRRSTARQRASADIRYLELVIETFKVDAGYYPTSEVTCAEGNFRTDIRNSYSLYAQLTEGRECKFPPHMIQDPAIYVGSLGIPTPLPGRIALIDPWNRPYCYFNPTNNSAVKINRLTFDLWSAGPDGTHKNADDINNWR